jgi:hypothetical protein
MRREAVHGEGETEVGKGGRGRRLLPKEEGRRRGTRRQAGRRRRAGRPGGGSISDVSREQKKATARCDARNERIQMTWSLCGLQRICFNDF